MIEMALQFALTCFSLALLMNLWPILTGPTAIDRVLALDTLVVNMIAIIVLYGIPTGDGINFEAAILFAMTGFVSSVAFAKYMMRGSIIE